MLEDEDKDDNTKKLMYGSKIRMLKETFNLMK